MATFYMGALMWARGLALAWQAHYWVSFLFLLAEHFSTLFFFWLYLVCVSLNLGLAVSARRTDRLASRQTLESIGLRSHRYVPHLAFFYGFWGSELGQMLGQQVLYQSPIRTSLFLMFYLFFLFYPCFQRLTLFVFLAISSHLDFSFLICCGLDRESFLSWLGWL